MKGVGDHLELMDLVEVKLQLAHEAVRVRHREIHQYVAVCARRVT